MSACSSTESAQAERDAEWILAVGTQRTLGGREREVLRPETATSTSGPVPAPPAGYGEREATQPEPATDSPATRARTRLLDLPSALHIAVQHSRGYLAEREGLLLQALGLATTRHAFSPRVSASLGAFFADGEDLRTSRGLTLDAGVDQVLPWGGSASLDLSSAADYPGGPSPLDQRSFQTGIALGLRQPLLRGFGQEVALEPLAQAEREMLYAIREFELFREDFSIDVARRFYDLVSQRQAIDNQRRNLEGFVFNRRQAEALFAVGRTSELEVLRARRSELSSQNDLIASEEAFALARDLFRIFLGLPGEVEIDIQPAPPPFVPTAFDLSSAIDVALANRLDFLNRKERLADAQRAVRIARDSVRPDLDLELAYGLAGEPADDFDDQQVDRDEYRAALTLGLPLDRVQERNSLRAAEISLVQNRRGLEEFRDNLVAQIESALRELARREQSLAIQRQLIEDQEKNAKIARLRFEQGDFSNRDLVEAEEALLEARNSLIREQVGYEIGRLSLLRDLGILFIDEKGMWVE